MYSNLHPWQPILLIINISLVGIGGPGSFTSSLNETNITLTPKIDNPQSMRDYRPISLCNVLYKIVAVKVLTIVTNVYTFNEGRC